MMAQARLTESEIRRLPTGNQHSDNPSVIEWQCVKGAAVQYGVTDWIAEADTSLTYEENIALFQQRSVTGEGGPSMRDLPMLLQLKRR